jgi:hypothetical protein
MFFVDNHRVNGRGGIVIIFHGERLNGAWCIKIKVRRHMVSREMRDNIRVLVFIMALSLTIAGSFLFVLQNAFLADLLSWFRVDTFLSLAYWVRSIVVLISSICLNQVIIYCKITRSASIFQPIKNELLYWLKSHGTVTGPFVEEYLFRQLLIYVPTRLVSFWFLPMLEVCIKDVIEFIILGCTSLLAGYLWIQFHFPGKPRLNRITGKMDDDRNELVAFGIYYTAIFFITGFNTLVTFLVHGFYNVLLEYNAKRRSKQRKKRSPF